MNGNKDYENRNVGIIAMEAYFPSTYVNQDELEDFDGVSKGKYTKGLGQYNMAFVGDREDICSISLTVTKSLMDKYNIPYSSIGRLEVGTETIIDKSKSVKSVLMQLFHEKGNTDIEGVDNLNACYGGTSALFNAVYWIQSESWKYDKRYALVITGDIAVYSEGPARPTGGCGVVAILVGPNANIVVELEYKGHHSENSFDFYKPLLNSEYPIVDGQFSVECYLRALDICFERFKQKWNKKNETQKFNFKDIDFALFHTPYCKLVQKAFARLRFNDFLENAEDQQYESVLKFKETKKENSYMNRDLETAFMTLSNQEYIKKVEPSLFLSRELGNIYCGSLYATLLSLISQQDLELIGKRALLFSFGSGVISSMFSVYFRNESSSTSIKEIATKANIYSRINNRIRVTPSVFAESLKKRELISNFTSPSSSTSTNSSTFTPSDSLFDTIQPSTYYLSSIDDKYRRSYKYKEEEQKQI